MLIRFVLEERLIQGRESAVKRCCGRRKFKKACVGE